MAFPVTARYFVRFRHSDIGLTPSFTFFKRTDTLAPVTPPSIVELGTGTYFFDWTFTLSTSPDIVFEVDGGVSIPTEEVRYVADTISPKDYFLDEPISQVKDDVWNDPDGRGVGTKGKHVELIGVASDTSAAASLFGKTLLYKEYIRGDSAGTSDGNSDKEIYTRLGVPNLSTVSLDIAAVDTKAAAIKAKTDNLPSDPASNSSVKGPDNRNLSELAGAGFLAGTDTLEVLGDRVSVAGIRTSVWDAPASGHMLVGSTGGYLSDLRDEAIGKWEILTTGPDANRLVLYRVDGITVLKKFDLQDVGGSPNFNNPFKRIPV